MGESIYFSNSGIIGIRTSQKLSSVCSVIKCVDTPLEITVVPGITTSDEIKAQLHQLGIDFPYVDKKIDGITKSNGNNLADREELDEIDKYLEEVLSKNKEATLAAIKITRGKAFRYAHDNLRKDPEIALAAIKYGFSYWNDIPETLRKNPSFQKEAFLENYRLAFTAPDLAPFREDAFTLERKFINLDIIPERFKSYVTAWEIIDNRENAQKKDCRPLAVVIFPKEDRTNAFMSSKINKVEELIERDYRVLYFEARNEEEVYKALKIATKAQKADLLILGGHGDSMRIAFGAEDPAKGKVKDEHFYIDLSDRKEMIERNLSNCLAENSIIVLASCSTGDGKNRGLNVVNFLKGIFPQAEVFAPTQPTNEVELLFDKNDKVIGVNFKRSKAYSTLNASLDLRFIGEIPPEVLESWLDDD